MLRCVVREAEGAELPAVDLAPPFVVGSGPAAQLRLPAIAARDAHVRIEADHWRALAEVTVDGAARAAGEGGAIGAGVELALGGYRVRIASAPAGSLASPPQRTESLARELVRGLLGDGAAPALEVEHGPLVGVRRALPPPGATGEATLVIGRGDEASWVIAHDDLSRAHVELRRGWDGVTLRDLGSKNGTRVDGVAVRDVVRLHDGARIELGSIVLRFSDPAERHLRGASAPRPVIAEALPAPSPQRAPAAWPLAVAVAIAALAIAGLAWVLAS